MVGHNFATPPPLQVEADHDVASQRFLWTGLGFAGLMLIGVSAQAHHRPVEPSGTFIVSCTASSCSSHAFVGPPHFSQQVAFVPMPIGILPARLPRDAPASSTGFLSGGGHARPAQPPRVSSLHMGFFDGIGKAMSEAMANDDTLGEKVDPGLKNKVLPVKVTWKGPEPEGMARFTEKAKQFETMAMPGTSFKQLAEDAGVEVSYSCNAGTCRICDLTVNGMRTPACVNKVQAGRDLEIDYKDVATMKLIAKDFAIEEAKERKRAKQMAKEIQSR